MFNRPGRTIDTVESPKGTLSNIPAAESIPRGSRPGVVRKAGGALWNWWRAAMLDALLVGLMWFLGLEILRVPAAPMWAGVAALAQFVPAVGGMLALIGPALSLLFARGGWQQFGLLLGLYAIIVVIDQLAIQPLVLRKMTRVPIWASIFGPILLGIVIPFWGVLLAPPLLAVVYAFRKPKEARRNAGGPSN